MAPRSGVRPHTFYDRVAEGYAAHLGASSFAEPGRDLLAMLDLRGGETLLDLGAGPGVVVPRAAREVGPTGRVIALDPSAAMLRLVPSHANVAVVQGRAPELPLAPKSTDAVLGNFVVSHLPDPVGDLARVRDTLRPGGRLAVSAWMHGENEAGDVFREVLSDALDLAALAGDAEMVAPHEARFAESGALEDLLVEAGFVGVRGGTRTYPAEASVEGFLVQLENLPGGNLARERLGAGEWRTLKRRVAAELVQRVGRTIAYANTVACAVGTNPS